MAASSKPIRARLRKANAASPNDSIPVDYLKDAREARERRDLFMQLAHRNRAAGKLTFIGENVRHARINSRLAVFWTRCAKEPRP
jgi:hypothetical protein